MDILAIVCIYSTEQIRDFRYCDCDRFDRS